MLRIGPNASSDEQSAINIRTDTQRIGVQKNPTGEYILDVSGSINCDSIFVGGAQLSASSGSGLAGVWTQDASNNISYSLGNVGIGTTDPSYALDVSGDMRASGDLYTNGDLYADSDLYASGDLYTTDGDLFLTGDISMEGDVLTTGDMVLDGSMVIGKSSFDSSGYALDVSGEVQIVGGLDVSGYLKVPFGSSNVSSTAFEGYIRYNDVSNEFQGYDASENVWSSLGAGSSTDTATSDVSFVASGYAFVNSYTVSSTDYSAYQFVQDGTFTVNTDVYADILIVGGGGAGGVGNGYSKYGVGGGGGGGQVLAVSNISLVANQSYSVIVGAGGINQGAINDGLSGELSSFDTYQALGGGGGGGAAGASDYTPADSVAGYNSGGGGSGFNGANAWTQDTNVGSAGTSLGGYSGGGGSYKFNGNYATSGGGGGAGGAGGAGGDSGGDGGIGLSNNYWDGNDYYYGGGGGGGDVRYDTGETVSASGGSGGGGAGFASGTVNTGGGGGGTDNTNLTVGYGGSGVVIIRINLTNQGIATTSDDRLKHNEEDISGLELITQLHPQKYLKTRMMYAENYALTVDASGNYTNLLEGDSVHEEMGVIAQDVLKIPELNFCVVNTTPYSLKYDNLFVLSIQAIKELNAKNNALQTSHDALQTELTELKALLQSKGLLD